MMNIPPRYEKAEYTDVPQKVREKFSAIAESRKGIYIFGPVGTGKTHCAFAMKKEWDSKATKKAEFWNTSELMQEIKDDFDRRNADKSRVYENIMEEKRLLFLDDIGSEKLSDWVLERFYLIVNKRYNDMVPVVFTSNYSIEELAGRVGDRIASRIVEMCDVVKIDGEDRRLK